ncbi:hypothetical protein NNA36_04975 [Shimia sp. CNT1-13L.2]|uniref:calcium-binding protein n=1 Tax=Shimia sp. CNT1-13L.2 TaxID=2959663 RepID=UPI0020CFAB2E|nr:calcium-binding protein [Shimia sp. CNT1-13L.2]MCP9481307.1 hypothetical protein [Shimia sp. CNT1-13L.2]
MALNVVSTLETTSQFVNVNDPLVVARDGAVITQGTSISGVNDDALHVSISGQVTSISGNGLQLGSLVSDTSSLRVSIAETGLVETLGNLSGVAIERDRADIINHGTISATHSTALFFTNGVEDGEVLNTGTISGGSSGYGILLFGDSSGTNTGLLEVDNSGTITSGFRAVYVRYESLAMVNSGSISSTDDAVYVSGTDASLHLMNSGSITSESGGYAIVGGDGGNFVMNSGDILGRTYLRNGNDQIVNQGTMTGQITTYSGTDFIQNSGVISGDIYMFDDRDIVENSGKIHGSVDLGDGDDEYESIGGIVTGEVRLGDGSDTAIVDQDGISVDGGNGYDVVHSRADVSVEDVEELHLLGNNDISATVNGVFTTVFGNSGDNTVTSWGVTAFNAKEGDDVAYGSLYDDFFNGNSGNDTLLGAGGDDTIWGGRGDDEMEGGNGADHLSGDRGKDYLNGDDGDDSLYGREGSDTLDGEEGNDLLWGGAGADEINGSLGNDTLVGHKGDDTLSGGAGVDVLTGGIGADVFVWSDGAESGLGSDSDTVTDFTRGQDLLDLSDIGVGAFSFLGRGNPFTASGDMEARIVRNGSDLRLLLDVDGDGGTDARIILTDVSNLTASDFIL